MSWKRTVVLGALLVGCSSDPAPTGEARSAVLSSGSSSGLHGYGAFVALPGKKALAAAGGNWGTAGGELWSETSPPVATTITSSLVLGRRRPAAVVLASGDALICGGETFDGVKAGVATSCERFEVATSTWKAGPSMLAKRTEATAVRLSSGKILVAGGFDGTSVLSSAELWDLAAGSFTSTGAMSVTRRGFTLDRLADGRVLAVGGGSNVAELYDESIGTWSSTGSTAIPRLEHASALLSTGEVLIVGGTFEGKPTGAAEIYSPSAGTFTGTSPMPTKRTRVAAGTLGSGRVLTVGGNDGVRSAAMELFDPVARTWSVLPSLPGALDFPQMIVDGDVALIANGITGIGAYNQTVYRFTQSSVGQACSSGLDCSSSFCVDGVCCDTACTGQCQACDVAPSVGTCSAVSGVPHGGRASCAPFLCAAGVCGATCSGDSTCDAGAFCSGGACTPKKAQGSTCAAANECASGQCVDGVCCESACGGTCYACNVTGKLGQCAPITGAPRGARTGCAPYACLSGACAGGCSSDADCATGNRCSGTSCVPRRPDGEACAGDSACTSGHCVDGVCCDTACTGQCQACDLTGKVGVCSSVDGAPHGARTSCSPSVCVSGACAASCTTDAQCVKGAACVSGACKINGTLGAACTRDAECASGACADGVCCDRACKGQCEACDVTGKSGTCTPISGDPHGARPACAKGSGTCDARTCDGARDATQCLGWAAGPTTPCAPAACEEAFFTPASTCSGSGACRPSEPVACAPYGCTPEGCRTSCAADADCAAGHLCRESACIAREKIATCSGDGARSIAPDGTQTPCGAYLCAPATGRCANTCADSSACAAGHACADGTCAAAAPAAADEGGCSVGAPGRSSRGALAALALVFAMVVRRRRAVVLGALGLLGCSPEGTSTPVGTTTSAVWTAADSVSSPRAGDVVTFSTGVLAAGGGVPYGYGAELFDASLSIWRGTINAPSATDSVLGRIDATHAFLVGSGGAATYDATTNTWTTLPAPLHPSRLEGAACAWSSGAILVAGGADPDASFSPMLAAELWNGTSWVAAGTLGESRLEGRLVCLADGRAIFLGGYEAYSGGGIRATTEIWSPTTKTFSAGPTMVAPRTIASAVPLPSGKLLVLGGATYSTNLTELFDPTTNTFSAGPNLVVGRGDPAPALLLPSGRVLVAGSSGSAVTEVIDLAANTSKAAGSLPTPRTYGGLGLLPGDRVLHVGGVTSGGVTAATAILKLASDGTACAAGGECLSYQCADGVCCDTACTAACRSCALPGKVGVCSPVASGPSPAGHPSCAPYFCSAGACGGGCTADDSCVATSYCGGGACSPKKALGETCARNAECSGGLCVDGVCCSTSCTPSCEACNVAGHLGTCWPYSGPVYGVRPSCGAYVCKGGGCGAGCTSSSDCASGFVCEGGACVVRKDLGGTCTADASCVSGHCVDGVCCDTACTGVCSSCNVTGRVGVCTGVDGPPRGGRTGCAPFTCVAGTCPTACSKKSDCASGFFCESGACKAEKARGEACSVDEGCATGHCVDGRCCDRACDGQCEACDVASKEGTCTPVVGEPHGARPRCSDGAGDVCGALACNGSVDAAKCTSFVNGPEVECAPARCDKTALVLPSKCDGAGHCPAPLRTSCAPYLCRDKACLASCAETADCAPGHRCLAGKCEAVSALCSADGTHVEMPDGTTTSCAPFVCKSGACVSSCADSTDCPVGTVCDPGKRACVAPTAPTAEDGGGCTVGKTGSSWSAWALLGLLGCARRRRDLRSRR